MRRRLAGGAALAVAALSACRSPAPGGFRLLFLNRSPAAIQGGLSWAPDPEHSRILAFDRALRIAKSFAGPRLARPVAVAALGGNVLVTEETGEGVVFDTAGHALREWQSPDYASLYAAAGTRIAAVRSPYRVPVLGEGVAADTAPLIRMLDTLGRQVAGLASARVPALPLLTAIVNAGATAVGPDGAVYFAPLVQDEIRKYAPGGALRWATRRGLFRRESDPEFLPQKG
ncbi:MAG TPA: hypothetical protein VEK78_15315, partial [Gemmatimonadales bacterium]|nr:hypothetical protein [Gemmatimonadales bacterium]